jgi:glycogen phosphorylase
MQSYSKNSHYKALAPNNFDIPRRIQRLSTLAYNLWWSWKHEAMRLFVRIDRDLWEKTGHNPISFLKQVERSQLTAMTQDRVFLERYDRVVAQFDDYMRAKDTWFVTTYPQLQERTIAYFSMEFGLHETLALYAGGLGVLSGDHLKEASDLGMPLVGLGFLYTKGYFSQRITEDGWQETNDFSLNIPETSIMPVYDADGNRIRISVELPERTVSMQIWLVQVGRVPLFLLDSDVEGNTHADRQLTANLYSGNPEMRIQQEILLGIGGLRALRKLGYSPDVWHMNEGHSAFLALERLREMVQDGIPHEQAIETIRATNVFTTHTPIPAGNDEFPTYLVEKYFAQYWPGLNMDRDQFIRLASCQRNWGEAFSMPVLAIRLSEHCNAVSELHGQVTRRMWSFLWPKTPQDEIPISHVTNGIHAPTWIARRLKNLFDTYLGEDWMGRADDPDIWENIEAIPDTEFWAVRHHLKRKLVLNVKERARQQWIKGSMHPVQVIAAGVLLDPYALTIGFARRFAPYKRANLILRDLDRLLEILNKPNMPVQIIFAGKSHPDNEPGKLLIQEVYRAVKKAENGGRLVFLEDYDMNLARYLVQGVDVWLNTPRRPNEASGTSGQKAALNGVLNFSILDGWWREGYNGRNGWAIGEDSDPVDPETQARNDAEDLYNILENEIIPLYYQERSADGLPAEWIGYAKESIRTLAPQFITRRMVKEYANKLYLPGLVKQAKQEA